MPQALKYINPNDISREKLGGSEERQERSKEYEKNKKYYEGKHPEWLIQEMNDPINDNITINITKTAVDRTASFLFPEMPIFQIDLNQDTDEETWLNNAWLTNGGAYFLSVIAQNGALSGHNYVKVLPKQDFPRLVAINPTVPVTYWKADDPETVLWHELRWLVGRDETIQDIINNEGKWEIHEYTRRTGNKRWVEDISKFIIWNSPIPPMIAWPHLPNPNNYYGLAEVTDTTRDLNDDINRVASDIGKILRYHASPRTIATGTNEGKINPSGAVNGLFTIEDPNAKVYNLEMQSDLSSSMAFLTYLNDAYLTLTRVVVMKGTVKDFQRVTNTGIQAVFIDMIAKNNLLRWTYGIGLQKICQALLFVGKKTLDILPTVTWPDPLPSDPLETVNRMVIEQANGWNNPKSISQSLGYEWGVNVKNWNEVIKYEWIVQGKSGALGKAPNSNSSLNNQNLDKGAN